MKPSLKPLGCSVDLPTGVWGALLYPPQILTSDIPLAAQLLAIEGRDMVPTSPTPGVLGTSAPQTGGNASTAPATSAPTPKRMRQDEEEATDSDEVPEECPHRKCKEGKALKEPRREASSKSPTS